MFKGLRFWKFNRSNETIIGETPDTFISEKTILDANTLNGYDSIRVDGTIKGNVIVENTFTLGETGVVMGDISANNVIIAGGVAGNITSKSSVHLTSTAKVVGKINSIDIIVDEGAKIKGTCVIGDIEKDFQFTPTIRTNGIHVLE